MNWCLRQKPAEPQTNAVERLLARAEEVVGLFEAMFGRLAGDANPLEAEGLSKLVATYAFADAAAGIRAYQDAMGAGKIILKP